MKFTFSLFLLLTLKLSAQTIVNYSMASTSTGIGGHNINCITADTLNNYWFAFSGGISKFDGVTWKSYTKTDGLIDNEVYWIAVDKNNIKWIGTDKGVSRFNDTTFTNFTKDNGLGSNRVYKIVVDSNNVKWFGHSADALGSAAISKYNDTTWTLYDHSTGLGGGFAFGLTIDPQGIKWFGTQTGLYKYNDTSFVVQKRVPSLVKAIAFDKSGNKWFGTQGGGLWKLHDTTWTYYSVTDFPSLRNIENIVVDSAGNKWFSTTDKGVWKYNDTIWTQRNSIENVYEERLQLLYIDKYGTQWYARLYSSYNVSKFDGTNWTHYNTNGIIGNTIHDITIDPSGNKWFVTSNSGISKFNDTTWVNYNKLNGLPNFNYVIDFDKNGKAYVGGDDYLTTLQANNMFTIVNTTASYYVDLAIDSDNNPWMVGNSGYITKMEGTTKKLISYMGDPTSSFLSINIDKFDNKWVGTYNGLAKFDGQNWTIFPELVSKRVYAINFDADGNVWVGSENGVHVLRNDTWTFYTTNYTWVTDIAFDKQGNTWVATYGSGILKFDGTKWTSYNTTEGLAENYTNTLAIDKFDNVWVGTERAGVSVIMNENPLPNKINEAIKPEQFALYPNPAKDKLHFDLSGKQADCQIYNMSGSLVLQQTVNTSESVNISALQPGIYILKVIAAQKVYIQEFIKN